MPFYQQNGRRGLLLCGRSTYAPTGARVFQQRRRSLRIGPHRALELEADAQAEAAGVAQAATAETTGGATTTGFVRTAGITTMAGVSHAATAAVAQAEAAGVAHAEAESCRAACRRARGPANASDASTKRTSSVRSKRNMRVLSVCENRRRAFRIQ